MWTPFHKAVHDEAKLHVPKKPINIAVKLHAVFEFPYPSKWRKAQRTGVHPHTSVPDVDNLVKGIGDMLQQAGVVEDDKFIVAVSARKQYNATGGVFIQLEPDQKT